MFFKKKKPKIKAINLTGVDFNDTISNTSQPILLDFWSSWCGPCKVMGPIIDELAREYQGKAVIAKVNTEEEQQLSAHFQIKSIPTLLFIQKGKVVMRHSGLMPKPNLSEILDQLIESSNEDEEE